MKGGSATDATVTAFRAAMEAAPDARTACIALIGAAAACHELLKPCLPQGHADELLNLLSFAGALLIEGGAGPLDLAEPMGRA